MTTKKIKSGDWSGGDGLLPGREALGPLFLMAVTPNFVMVFYHVVAKMDGDFLAFGKLLIEEGFWNVMRNIWPNCWDPVAWKLIAGFFAFELLLMRLLPGKTCTTTLTPKGNLPVYTANGMQAYFVTLIVFLGLTYFGYIRPALVYDKFGEILASLNIFALFFCTLLLIKGHVAPSTTDSGSTGSFIYDFYWGMELYPRILGFDVKMFTNCRAGMMFWAVGILCFAHKNMEVNAGVLNLGMAVNVALQLIYITKFFLWEMGYMASMDIQHDRAGYYICWGCLVWLPCIYTHHSFYLAEHAPEIQPLTALAIFLAGFAMIWMNYESDNQRYIFRTTRGNCTIFGRVPKRIEAKYSTASGEHKTSLLLLSGFWAISRHFHYVPEVLASVCWCLPALDTGFIAPYFYPIYLSILLLDRAYRDDDRCRKKYGPWWDDYCSQVPYKVVPGVV